MIRCRPCRVAFAIPLLALGCSGEARPKAEPAPEAPAQAAPAQAAPAEPAPVAEAEPTPEELPVREDFEAEAEQEITAENFRAELDKLERELEAEP